MPQSAPVDSPHRKMSGSTAALCCAILLALFGWTSWRACAEKSATTDEPLHLVSAYLFTHNRDFRCDPDSPPLWKYLAAAATNPADIKFDFKSESWRRMLLTIDAEGAFTHDSLFSSADSDFDAILRRSRLRVLFLAIALGALIARWAWELGGGLAAISATALFAMDPNFLAHAPLIKNDVAISLATLALAYSVWKLGERINLARLLITALVCSAALCTKFSAVAIVPLGLVPLLFRAWIPRPWPALRHVLQNRSSRLAAAAGIMLACGAVSIGAIWACYDFRFAPSPDGATMDFHEPFMFAAKAEALLSHRDEVNPSQQQIDQWIAAQRSPRLAVRFSRFLNDHRLLPQSWIAGFLYTYIGSLSRKTFLWGQYSRFGWWYYFPLAMLFKTPLATLAAMPPAMAFAILKIIARRRQNAPARTRPPAIISRAAWTACCLLVAPVSYLALAMSSHIDLGLRHVLPVYPFIYIAVAITASAAWARFRKTTTVCLCVLGLGLLSETACAFPDYIPFFNVAAGGARGGVELLADSNLDWGQDLRLLVDWQKQNPDRQLYLVYFGGVDPRIYGLPYVKMPGNSFGGTELPDPHKRPVLALSVSALQGAAWYPTEQNLYAPFRKRKPLAVLGGSIYLFDPAAD